MSRVQMASPRAPLAPPGTRCFGLTGGIATGKSTVSAMLRELGLQIVDADAVAREVVAPSTPALAEIAARFPEAVRAGGTLDRARLGALVFSDASARAALEAITHPRIAERVAERLRELAAAGASELVYDAALLLENGLQDRLSGVILVVAPVELQRERLVSLRGLSPDEADARVRAQWSEARRRPFARWIIDNGGSLEATRRQVERVAREIRSSP